MTAEVGRSAPERSVEIERKYDAAADVVAPDWGAIPGVAAVDAVEVRHLDAIYFDTPDLAWGRAGYAVRRRTGGPDAGWHIKGPLIDGGRTELAWPLTDGAAVPDAVLAALPVDLQGAATSLPVARLQTERHARVLRDRAGAAVAEVVDDHVTATDLIRDRVQSWREWEVELGAAAPDDHATFFAVVDDVVFAAGGKPAARSSKLARALTD